MLEMRVRGGHEPSFMRDNLAALVCFAGIRATRSEAGSDPPPGAQAAAKSKLGKFEHAHLAGVSNVQLADQCHRGLIITQPF
jgi:hypothetical protein